MGKTLHDILSAEFPATNFTVTVSEDGCYNIDYWSKRDINSYIEWVLNNKVVPRVLSYSIQRHGHETVDKCHMEDLKASRHQEDKL